MIGGKHLPGQPPDRGALAAPGEVEDDSLIGGRIELAGGRGPEIVRIRTAARCGLRVFRQERLSQAGRVTPLSVIHGVTPLAARQSLRFFIPR